MSKPNLFVCLVGMDGTGKTSLSKNIIQQLHENHIPARYVYGRLRPLLLKPFIWIGNSLILKGNSEMQYDYTKRSQKILKHPILSDIYRRLLIMDYVVQVLVKIRLPLMLGETVVCDRYVYDTIINDVSFDYSFSNEEVIQETNKLLTILPKPDLVFLLDVQEEAAMGRKTDVPSIQYLRDRRVHYLLLGRTYQMKVLDASLDPHVLQSEALKSIYNKLEAGACG
ncbi:MAG TPA: hypothetical protein VE134_08300 [Methanomicrobiales archaeon]|nr:hypothetical protein [Methanomicrobiales archaeon]